MDEELRRLGAFARADTTEDERFYAVPRFVTHIDAGAVTAVTQLYREWFPPGGTLLDLMSSWVSHLPPRGPLSSGDRPGAKPSRA